MNCKEAILLMHDYLDGELPATETIELKKHLLVCPECKERYAKLEKTEAIITSLKPIQARCQLTSDAIMNNLPAPAKRATWMKWPRRHPAASVAAIFFVVMLSSFLTMWDTGAELVLQGDIEHVVVKGNTVVVPEGQTVQGNLIVENGEVVVNGKINGNLTVIDGHYALASTAQISGNITLVNQAVEWIWYKANQVFTAFAK